MSGNEMKFESGTWRMAKSTVARPEHEVGRPDEPDVCVFVDDWPDGWTVIQRPALRWQDPLVATVLLTESDGFVETKRGREAVRLRQCELILSVPFEFLLHLLPEPVPLIQLGWQSVDDNERMIATQVRMLKPYRFALGGDEDGHPYRMFMTGRGRNVLAVPQ